MQVKTQAKFVSVESCPRALLSDREPDICKAFDGITPLYVAANEGKTESAKVLLGQAHIDVNKSTSALYDAFWSKAYETLGIKSVHLLTLEALETLMQTIPKQVWQSILEGVFFQGKGGMGYG